MAAIRDDTSTRFEPTTYAGVEDFLADAKARVEHFRLDRQKRQRRRLLVICEAAGMAPQLYYGVTERYGISVLPSGGFDSLTDKHSYAQEWSAREQPTTVLHIGDYDESGETMFDVLNEDIGAFAVHYGGDVEFVRVAVTPEQMRQFELALGAAQPQRQARARHHRDLAGRGARPERPRSYPRRRDPHPA